MVVWVVVAARQPQFAPLRCGRWIVVAVLLPKYLRRVQQPVTRGQVWTGQETGVHDVRSMMRMVEWRKGGERRFVDHRDASLTLVQRRVVSERVGGMADRCIRQMVSRAVHQTGGRGGSDGRCCVHPHHHVRLARAAGGHVARRHHVHRQHQRHVLLT